jgi:hypothetical protein
MFNDEINVTQGLEEIIYTELPEETETDYKQASKTDRLINQTYIIANQHTQEIEALTQKVIPVSNTISGIGEIQLENAYEGILHYLSIKGNISTITPVDGEYGYALMPSETLTPSETLMPSKGVPSINSVVGEDSILLIDNVEYNLDLIFLNYLNNEICDEFIYEDGKCKIIRRLGIDSNGDLYKLEKEIIEYKTDINLEVESNSTIKLKSFNNVILKAEYLLQNEFTNNFVTEVDAIARINLSPGKATIQANKIALEGYTTINKGFSVDLEGNMTAKNGNFEGNVNTNSGNIGGWKIDENGLNNNDIFVNKNGYSNIYTVSDIFIIRMIMSGEWTPNEQVLKHYDLNNDGVVDVSDLAILTAWVMGKGNEESDINEEN